MNLTMSLAKVISTISNIFKRFIFVFIKNDFFPAIRTMGPEVVVKHIPLQITGKEESYEFPRSWLLPVLRENIQNANLSFFKTYFLPMAMACQARASKAENENDKIGQKSYEMLVSQIWSLLPGMYH